VSEAVVAAPSEAAPFDMGVRRVLDHLDDAVVVARTEDLGQGWSPTVLYANEALATLTGHRLEVLVASSVDLWAPADQNAGAHDAFRRALAAGERARAELVLRRPSGDVAWAETVVSPLGSDGLGRALFIEVMRDVTARRNLRQLLLEAQAVAHVGSWEWDVGSNHVGWSDELYRVFGLRPQEFDATYEAYVSRVHPEDRPLAEANVRRSLETDQPFAADYRIVLPGGQVRWLRSHGRVVRTEGSAPRLVGTCQDITEQKELEQALARQALHDHLTGLPNRVLLADRLELALSRAARHERDVAILFIDLDEFKAVNDQWGHDAGDAVLVTVARRLQSAVRPSDTVARYGGDEFVAVCEEISPEDALELARRISAAVRTPIEFGTATRVMATASVGVALGRDAGREDLLIRDADAAMYRAKSAGRGHVELVRATSR
jgi:diguanylate cyclase (GGDEF)-like protein/PAS domain S-box-containing protein